MAVYKLLYFPILMTCCFVTLGYWLPRLFGGDNMKTHHKWH